MTGGIQYFHTRFWPHKLPVLGETSLERPMTPDPQTSTGAVRGYLLVLLAASLWATLGVIYTLLARAGLAAITVAALRAGLGGLLLLAGLFIFRRGWLRINRRALRVVLLYGVLGVALFYASYVNAILSVGVAVAAVLLYTAPAWVALIAWRFLGEQLTRRHVAALLLTLIGTALVAQVFRSSAVQIINVSGIFWGLMAGLTYGLWSVFNKVGVRHTNPWTLQCYGMLVGAVALLVVQPPLALGNVAPTPQTVFWLLALTLGPTVGASVAYAAGVRTVPVSVASLVATLEPVLAALLAFVVLGETLNAGQLLGGGLILLAVWLLRPRFSRVT